MKYLANYILAEISCKLYTRRIIMQMLVLLYKYIKNIKSILYYKNIGALPRVLVVLTFVLFGAIYDKKWN